uniref:Small ribosomal subunit protein mS29 n=1 Tax=Aegilops tauschii TaxID=37682 RepID=M8C4P3_AEGTA
MKGADTVEMPEGSTLYDLIQTGITHSHAAVGVVVRLRKELSLVKDVPVLFAIDQYNSWFTFTEYQEPVTVRSCRSIHAKELTTVIIYG